MSSGIKTHFQKGDALAIVSFMMGRSDSTAWEGVFATDICAWDYEYYTDGAKETIDKIENRVHNQADWLELGPAPGMPFFVPKSACDGTVWPKLPTGLQSNGADQFMWSDMTRAMWAGLPYTFVKKTLRGQSLEVAFFNKATVPFQAINPQHLSGDPLDLQGVDEDIAHPGYSTCVFTSPAKGCLYSGWMFHVDGVLRTAWIEHRQINADGSEADTLTPYWRPKDIFDNIILPRINLNLPIKTFGWDFVIDMVGSPPAPVLRDAGQIHTGYIFKPRHIAAAQMQLLLDPSWFVVKTWVDGPPPIMFWETAFAAWAANTGDPVVGNVWNHYYSPAFCLPYFGAILAEVIANPSSYLIAMLWFLFGIDISGGSKAPSPEVLGPIVRGNVARVDWKDPVGITEAFNLFAPVLELLMHNRAG